MKVREPFNPLDKKNLGLSVAEALLEKEVLSLPPPPFTGAGIYAIYYAGSFQAYEKIASRNRNGGWKQPIYVGKAIPAGARRGGLGLDAPPGSVLHKRLSEHASSIEAVATLDLKEFACRYLTVEDIWIPLGESLLIEMFQPVWNVVVDGFGNHDPGGGRYNQQRSAWDVVHPGRAWAERCKPGRTVGEILPLISEHLAKMDTKA